MNGVHDMGGMHGMGPIDHKNGQAMISAKWEGRLFALIWAVFATGRLRMGRHEIEELPPVDYLSFSYYDRWLAAFTSAMVRSGIITNNELRTSRPDPISARSKPSLSPLEASTILFTTQSGRRNLMIESLFAAGQRIRTRNIHPATHTRLPRYARDKEGVIIRDQGVFNFPDTSEYGRGDCPQHVYSVRFRARDLWGDQASAHDTVFLDLWEDYLERF